jgi:nicotinamide phosphoribosyltransferase
VPNPLRVNPILRTDSYKLTHFRQYPPDAEIVYSYLESRGGFFDKALFSGLQYYLQAYLAGVVFTYEDIKKAADFAKQHFGTDRCFNLEGWKNLWIRYHGYLPLRIRAIREGEVVEDHNALMTIENTDPDFPWLTNWAETLLLKVWYPITVGTLSREIKQVIGRALERTGDPTDLPFKLHDFGYRGVSSEESAAIGGFAHLINFMGTDTLASIVLAQQYYGASMPAHSIPASEHSTITSWGGPEHEAEAYANMLDQYPEGLVACVSDSYDIQNAVEKIWGGILRERVNGRQGVLVVRPDSGEPVQVLEDIFKALENRFGLDDQHLGTKKGWKVLNPRVRVIQGDGVNYHTIQNITSQLTRKGWSQSNWGYGMGGALLQQLNRDTLRFAFKCSAIRRNGVWQPVYKNPKTDPSKASKGGRFSLMYNGSEYVTVPYNDTVLSLDDCLETVFLNGEVMKSYTLDDIRARAAKFDNFKALTT